MNYHRPTDDFHHFITAMPKLNIYCLYSIFFSILYPFIMAECPRACECKWKGGKESVVCTNANMTMVPPNLESGTQLLNLSENNIGTLRNQEFSNAGLINLQKIFLVRCRLRTIERYTFQNLINLVELDLGFNLLSYVPSHSLESIPELRELTLSGNPIQSIDSNAFIYTPQLIRLEMSHCRLSTINIESFLAVENSLKWLKLDNNRISDLEATSLKVLKNLDGLELVGNPWNCTCKLRELREWMIEQNVPYDIPPICHSPQRLLQKSWKVLELDEFACPPKIFASENKLKGTENDNITLICQIEGIPKPHVRWLFRNRAISNQSNPQNGFKKIYIINQKDSHSELVLVSSEIQDAGVYMCIAENKAGKSEATITLVVARKTTDSEFSQKAILLSVLLGVTFALVCCVLSACIMSLRKKRSIKWHHNQCRWEDNNYEKIELNQKVCHRNLNNSVSRESGDLVTITRKNGDYCVVPNIDTDHENDEEEESTLEITTPGTSNDKKWTNDNRTPQVVKNEPVSDACRTAKEDARDNIRRTYSSMFGTSESHLDTIPQSEHGSLKAHPLVNSIYSTARSIRQVPDVIGHPPISHTLSSRTQSENGSTSDINELFCTLPRKKELFKYKSSDSQSPLLPESRYGSDSSSDSFVRKLVFETQKNSNIGKQRSNNRNSGSMLNLAKDDRSLGLNSTPLLDVRGLETRLSPQFNQSTTISSNPYDFHAAQLEKFLEEYRVLQKQLTRMKETCDSICQDQMRDIASPCTSSSSTGMSSAGNLANQVYTPNSNSIQDSVDFKNFQNELTKYLKSRSQTSVTPCSTTSIVRN